MEPNPDLDVMKDLLKNLLIRSSTRDLFTVDAIKLLIDYEDNIPPIADCVSKMMKKAIHNGDICNPVPGQPKPSKPGKRVLTVENILGHLVGLNFEI